MSSIGRRLARRLILFNANWWTIQVLANIIGLLEILVLGSWPRCYEETGKRNRGNHNIWLVYLFYAQNQEKVNKAYNVKYFDQITSH